ncbi:DUF4129 domain-containing protein [Nocardioides dongxiaopingii]|uniref:DUF4129 domain-containing protein n=1 Tax=Nocardioides dongxiaopingii TaxID=2576036 RepID=UPI0010C767D1|nr:DUF4129 domain-containing protein [Nocardioides dongxiaopingii]
MTWSTALADRAGDPPLDPSADEARRLLQTELAKPDYYDDDLLQRLLDWIDRRISGAIDGASSVPPLTWFAITVLVVGLVGGVALLLSRARTTARRRPDRAGGVLTDEVATATELRARAERALAEGRHAEAVVDGFRALARRQVERGRLDDSPGITAREVAAALALAFPDRRDRTAAGADLFDAVRYGERPATREQAVAVLDLDRELAGTR